MTKKSNLVIHAERELRLCGQTKEDPEFSASLVAAVEGISSYGGHSGGSMFAAIEMLTKLLRFENLAPITNDPEEWMNVSDVSGSEMWQNRRSSAVFSTDGGKTHYHLDGPGQIIDSADYGD